MKKAKKNKELEILLNGVNQERKSCFGLLKVVQIKK
tara:strand:+ start:2604 stop:2711 length:108 start_codon:yes stop_codon:yes gene_type:complete